MPSNSDTTIEHVRLRNAQADVPVARLRLSYLMSSMDLRPATMPPSAVLVVRSMRDPLPQRITSEFVAAATPSRAWECAVQSRMADFYSGAARPASGLVPSSAESVLFSDYAELLACLALDIGKGAATSWWWQSILRRFSAHELNSWTNFWAEHPRYIPAALEILDRQRVAIETVKRISSAEAWKLLIAAARAFDLPEAFIAAIEHYKQPTNTELNPSFASQTSYTELHQDPILHLPRSLGDEIEASQLGGSASTTPPWEPWVSLDSAPASLGTAQRTLLGVSLLLNRRPNEASGTPFARGLGAWLLSQQSKDDRAASSHAAASFQRRFERPEIKFQAKQDDDFTSTQSGDLIPADIATPKTPPAAGAHVAFTRPATTEAVETVDTPSTASSVETPLLLERGVHTSLGGLFYLIHLVLQADLVQFDTGLSGWVLLDLLARCFLGQNFASYSDDPVWAALAELDDREVGQLPGASFTPRKTYQAPETWFFEAKPENADYVRFRSHRTEIWHKDGFLIFDTEGQLPSLPTGLIPLSQRQRRRFRSAVQVHPYGMALSRQLRRFLHFILPYVRWRLREALGETSPLEIMARAGILHITGSHIDLVMGMDQISLPARLAGLDANPGWVPQFGRVVTFHFIQEGFGNG